MKPIRFRLAPTDKDRRAWGVFLDRWYGKTLLCPKRNAMSLDCEAADARDLMLMDWLLLTSQAHYRGMFLPARARLPIVHLMLRMDSEWPLGHCGVNFRWADVR